MHVFKENTFEVKCFSQDVFSRGPYRMPNDSFEGQNRQCVVTSKNMVYKNANEYNVQILQAEIAVLPH